MSDGESDNEFLKGEDENDPIKVQKESIELQKEGIKLMKDALWKKLPPPPPVDERYVTSAEWNAPPRPISMTFNVRRIENGFIMEFQGEEAVYRVAGHHSTEIFCPTAEELVKVTAAKVETFTKEGPPVTILRRSGPPPFQLEPGEAV